MTEVDPFEYDDAAYVLGALSPAETAAFEEHLSSCPNCAARVREIEDMPWQLAAVSAQDVGAPSEPMPDTLLPGLLRRASAQRRRQRWLIGSLTAVAVACVAALVVVLWPSSGTTNLGGTTVAVDKAFVPVAKVPVAATATLTSKAWGTAIDLHCHYVSDKVGRSFGYDLVAIGRDGTRERLGSWSLPPDKDIDFPAGTWLPYDQIRTLEIRLPSGTPVLRLNL